MTRCLRFTIRVSATLAVAAMLAWGVSRAEAQIGPIPHGLADQRSDPLFLIPVISAHTQLRVAGVVHTKRPVIDPDTAGLIGETPTVAGRLTLFPPDGSPLSFGVVFECIPDRSAPRRTGFTGTIKTSELIGDVPTNTGAILTLDCTNCPRGSRISAGMHLEDVSLAPAPSFAPYVVGVIDPMVDGVIDPKNDGILDPRVDSLVLMPVVTAMTQLHVVGVAHSRRPLMEEEGIGLIGDTPTIRGRLTLWLPDGTSRFFDIPFRSVTDKDMSHQTGFTGVASLDLIGDVPTNTGASMAFDCVGCPGAAVISAGVYVEEISAVQTPSFQPYYVGVIDPKSDGTTSRRP